MTDNQCQQPRTRNRGYVYRPNKKARLVNRRGLVEFLLLEIQTGTSLTGLYAGLLINTILAEEPELCREYPNIAADNGLKVNIPRVRSRRAPC